VNITLQQLKCIMPRAGVFAVTYLPWLNSAMAEFGIDTKKRQVCYIPQLAHETGDLNRVTENLNYTSDALLATFNTKQVTRFTRELADRYGRNAAHPADQQMIANIAYANRMGNGDVASGDGWRYRGAGGIQLTGKDNQRSCAVYFRIPVDQVGDWLRTPEGAMRSAAWFWWRAGCNELADVGKIDAISDLVNIGHRTAEVGDAIGFADRQSRTGLADKVLA
jgi:putative chitinase